MNRKARRAALKGGSGSAGSHSYSSRDIEQLAARAGGLFREGRFEQVQDVCRQILSREPCHVIGNSLAGLVYQALGRDEIAVKHFAKAITFDGKSASFHYNIAVSYQKLNRWDNAVAHFARAIALRMDGMAVPRDLAALMTKCSVCMSR